MLTRGWLSRSLHRSYPRAAVRLFGPQRTHRESRHGPHADRACHHGVAFLLDPDLPEIGPDDGEGRDLRVPAKAADKRPAEMPSSRGSNNPSATMRARKRYWPRAGSRCMRIRSTTEVRILSLRSRTSPEVFWRPFEHKDEGSGRDGDDPAVFDPL